MNTLPIDGVLPELIQALKTGQSVVLEAPPGAGKSTRVPGAIVDSGLVTGKVVMLEPRRLAARMLAKRIAQERGATLGREVGYHVRFDRKVGPDTKIAVVTEGILTRQLQSDPFLEGVGAVILDEFHERSIHSDLVIAFLRELMEARDDLKVVVMSATIGTESVSDYLGSKVVSSPGRAFELTIRNVAKPPESMESGVAQAVRDLLADPNDDGGDILVFLPSTASIKRTEAYLRLPDCSVQTLYGAMRPEAQDAVLSPSSKRKVVLSTNIAETSLTIEGVTAVVDSGWVRRVYASKSSGFDELREERISMASAKQRAGRAGRTAPGRVVRLWTTAEEHRFTDYDVPEIRRIDLARPVMDVVGWTSRGAAEFNWFEAPRSDQITRAESLLTQLGLVSSGQLTDAGTSVLAMPLHPRLGVILRSADQLGSGALAADACAVASEQDFVTRVDDRALPVESDVLIRCEMLEAAASNGRIGVAGYQVSQPRARRVLDTSKRLRRFVTTKGRDATVVQKAIARGFPDRIAFRRVSNYAVSGGDSVVVGHESRCDADILAAVVLFGTDRHGNGIVRMGNGLKQSWLSELFGDAVEQSVEVSWDAKLNRVVARLESRFAGVKFEERQASMQDSDPFKVAQILAERASEMPHAAFGEDMQKFTERLVCAGITRPDLEFPTPGTPDWNQVLAQACYGKRGFSDLADRHVIDTFRGNLTQAQRQSLDNEFPERMQVPTGSKIKIDYSDPERPVLAVRIQEVFGMQSTPKLGGNRLAVVMHLLAPNYRPAQITTDLAGFWESSYHEVRKDLRARYPKHAWPEDPANAEPQRKGRSQKS